MVIDGWMIAAGLVLAVGLGVLIWQLRRAHLRRSGDRIEAYLRKRKEDGPDEGRCSIGQLMTHMHMTKGQVLQACRQSPAIMRLATTASFPGAIFTDAPVFEYAPLRGRG